MVGFDDEPSDEDAGLVQGVDQRRVVFGHTHVQFERTTPPGIQLVNPGSVGMPFDHDHRAAYALLHDDGRVELRRVEYDWRPVAVLMRERVGEPFASRFEQARFDATP
jgi:diadenosine tetraphosphatase ApaH/serine/threonine PP2A family protein phosphatase